MGRVKIQDKNFNLIDEDYQKIVNSTKDKFVIILDFDGVITNQARAKTLCINELGYNIKEEESGYGVCVRTGKVKEEDYIKARYKAQTSPPSKLPITEGFLEFFSRLKNLKNTKIFILTARFDNMLDHLESYLKHYNMKVDGIINTGETSKKDHLKNLNTDIFVDDSTHHYEKLLEELKGNDFLEKCTFILFRTNENVLEKNPCSEIIEEGNWDKIYEIILKKYSIQNNQKIRVVILAAGVGKRFGEKGKEIPKCLIKINDQTLLERQISILNNLGIEDITLVIGSQGECWTKGNIEKIKQLHKNIVINDKNVDLKRPYTLFCGLKDQEPENTIIFDGDLVFEKSLLEKVINDKRENLILAFYLESKNLKGGTRVVTDENNKLLNFGYGLYSNKYFSGIFKIGKKDFNLLKQSVSKKENWNENLSTILKEITNQTDFYVLTLNTSSPIVQPEEPKEEESWEPTIIYMEKNQDKIRKKTKIGKLKLKNEVDFITSLPANIRKHFPEIIDYNFIGEEAYYDMKFYEYPSFFELIFNNKTNMQESLDMLKTILDFNFNELYKQNIQETPEFFIRNSYFNKVEKRHAAVKGKSEIFDKIVSADYLIVNGKKIENFHKVINKIKQDIKFLASLEPPFVATYHGDFRFDNMLVNLSTKDFILIDPRGKTAAGHSRSDIIEDMSKILTTCWGHYPLLQKGLFDIEIKENPESKEISIDYKMHKREIITFFHTLADKFIEALPNYEQIKKDANWKKRLLFITPILLIANAPFHLTSKENEKFSIMILLRGIELLNEFLEKYPLNNDEKIISINMNTLEDYNFIKNFYCLFPE